MFKNTRIHAKHSENSVFRIRNETKYNVVESSESPVRKQRYGGTIVDRPAANRSETESDIFPFSLARPFADAIYAYLGRSKIGAGKCFVRPQTNAIGPRRRAGGNSRKRTTIDNGVKSSSASAVHNLISKLTFTRPARFSLSKLYGVDGLPAVEARPGGVNETRSRDNGTPEPMRTNVVENICEYRQSIENFDCFNRDFDSVCTFVFDCVHGIIRTCISNDV